MATITAGKNAANNHHWLADLASPEASRSAEGRTIESSSAAIMSEWQDGSQYLKAITAMPTPTRIETSAYLDLARRRAIWKGVTPLAILCSIVSGIATTESGLPTMIGVMAGTFVVTAILGRIGWPQ